MSVGNRGGRALAAAAVIAMFAGLLVTSPAGAQPDRTGAAATYHRRAGNVPHPVDATFDSRAGGSAVSGSASALRAQRALSRTLGPQGVMDVDERTGTPRMVSRLDGYLTGPSNAPASEVALDYVRSNLAAFGLTVRDLDHLVLVKDYVDVLSTHHLIWQQRFAGIPAFDNDLRAHVTGDGRLVAIGGSPIPGPVPSAAPRLSAVDAVSASYTSVGAAAPSLGAGDRLASGPQRPTTFRSGDEARLVLFGTGRGARLAWRTTSFVSSQQVYVTVVDAASGEILWQANLVKNDQVGSGQAWENYPSVTVPNNAGVQQTVSFPVADGAALMGNNAWTWPDVDDDDVPDRQIPATSGLEWNYPAHLDTTDASNGCSEAFPCSWQAGVPFSWQDNVEQNAVQVFHFLNRFHDHLLAAPIGFTEAAGNFQQENATGLGQEGDPVVANVMDGAATNGGLPDGDHVFNAGMMTLPDGEPAHMQMFLFPSIAGFGTPSANGGDDASVVYHEYTHGLSNRLVTTADGIGALNSAQAGALGEAWSDFYAMDFLVSHGLEVDDAGADVIVGKYLGGGRPDFIRFEPIDCRVAQTSDPNCPGGLGSGPGGFTYGDFGDVAAGPEVHSDGEIWVQTLWDVRSALGSQVALALVTRGMELAPVEPSFLDARNAILQADLVAFEGTHTDRLWEVFAERGMGFFAIAIDGGDVRPVQDFSVPPVCPGDCGVVSGRVLDSVTGEPVRGVDVAIAGHASGFLGDLAGATSAAGRFRIRDVPFHDYVVTVRSDAHEATAFDVAVDGRERIRIDLTRDWAALGGGAKLKSFTGPDYTPNCGPAFAWDTSLNTGWGSDHPNFGGGGGTTGPRINVVRLPRAVDVTGFGFAAAGTCGDGPRAAVKEFEIQTRTANGPWRTAYRRSGPLQRGVLHTLEPRRGSTRNVRFVRMIMLDNYGDPLFMDLLELTVRGLPA